jgi:hypothetical protein
MPRDLFNKIIGICVINKYYKNFNDYYGCMLNEGNRQIHIKRKEIKKEIFIKTRQLFNLNKNIFIFLLGWYFDENSTIYNLPFEIILSIAQKVYYSEGWPEYLLPLVEMRFVLFLRTY